MRSKTLISNYIPSNYFITKSMELTRDRTSGTLWYTKKFLVYYTYIFLNNSYIYKAEATQIASIFDGFIKSLPSELRAEARKFFFPSRGVNNPKSPNFRTFQDFAGSKIFSDCKEEKKYFLTAKKYYFAFLMEIGGQGKLNSTIQTAIYKKTFTMTELECIIESFYGNNSFDMTRRINDYMSSLRNERQVLYYYGFFHSKSSGATDEEFSSLTPIGELALSANYEELTAIWEHQKMRMISQPVTITLDKDYLKDKSFNVNDFHINRDPYYTLTSWLYNTKEMTLDEYKYLVSRTREPIKNAVDINNLKSSLNAAITKVDSFHRASESREKKEDFSKEVKKYLLGIRDDLRHDKHTAPLGMVSYKQSTITVKNDKKIDLLNHANSLVSIYKAQRYAQLFDDCEKELRKQYTARQSGSDYEIDLGVKIAWDMYIMKVDIPVMLLSMLLVCDKGRDELFDINHHNVIGQALAREMPNIMKYCGLTNNERRTEALVKLKEAFATHDFKAYEEYDEATYTPVVAKYIADSAQDLDKKVKDESVRPTVMDGMKRKRNMVLINVLKAYNIKCFGTTTPLKCECCGHETFLTRADEMYMEYHHLIPFIEQEGPDHYLNLFALCPLCHRKIHLIGVTEKKQLYQDLSSNNYRGLTIEQRLQELKKQKILKSYHLEYMFKENAIPKSVFDSLSSVS